MARPRDPEKRKAILGAAILEIAEVGLSVATAKIAARAGVAEGTLFTYFASKDELLNELYRELKLDLFEKVNAEFPHGASLERRARHVWSLSVGWMIESPEKRMVVRLLNLSSVVTAETRASMAQQRGAIDTMLDELDSRESLRELPSGYASALMAAMQEAAMDFAMKNARQRKLLIDRGFDLFWRAVR